MIKPVSNLSAMPIKTKGVNKAPNFSQITFTGELSKTIGRSLIKGACPIGGDLVLGVFEASTKTPKEAKEIIVTAAKKELKKVSIASKIASKISDIDIDIDID